MPRRFKRSGQRTTWPAIGLDEWASWVTFNGNGYSFQSQFSMGGKQEEIAGDFASLAAQAYKQNGVVFACMLVRMLLASEVRFQWREINQGRPGRMWGNTELEILEKPWTNGTTGDLVARMMQDADLAGNFYARRVGSVLQRMRPDWVSIIVGSRTDAKSANWQLDAEIAGYLYHPGGYHSGQPPIVLLPEEVAHFAPIPDPASRFRGMSLLSAIVDEIRADLAATKHKLSFFENGATPNLFISFKEMNPDALDRFQEIFEDKYQGVENAYKTLMLGGGADVKVIGADMKQLDFKVTQGAGETRICMAARVPPIIVGASEGLASATYSNYELAMKAFCDLTMRPLWRNMAASLQTILKPPPGTNQLWYDDRDIPALRQNLKDRADGLRWEAMAINFLFMAGFEPDTIVQAVSTGDLTLLQHTGLTSVQAAGNASTPAHDAANADAAGRAAALLNGHKEDSGV